MQEPINTPIPNPKPASNKLFKFAIIIIGLLIAIGLFLNAYLLLKKEKPVKPTEIPTPIPNQVVTSPTPPPAETATWKTYRNEKFNYEFKYPSSWKVKIAGATGADNYGNWILDEQTPDTSHLFEINVSSENSKEKCLAFIDPKKEFKISKIAINNIEWTKYEGPLNTVIYKAYYSKFNYCLSFRINPLSGNPQIEVLNLILSTFRFD